MRGKYRILVQNKRIRYDFEIRRNITIIRGDSATGKTTLIEMIREFDENGIASGIGLTCDKKCIVLSGRTWETQLSSVKQSIVFIDEGNHFITSKEFASCIQKSDNYYVIVARESLPTLPYSVEEIYGIHNSGKYGSFKQIYNEFYHLYGNQQQVSPIIPAQVITEDSKSGFQFFSHVCKKRGKTCISADGKSNMFSMAINTMGKETLMIADGAAFGAEIEKMMKLLETNKNLQLYLPESFEWLILKSGLLEGHDLENMLKEPYLYIDSEEDFSWERYFAKVLISRTSDTYLTYMKSDLNPVYLQQTIQQKILQVMNHIEL